MYPLIRPLLFSLEPEAAHAVSMRAVELAAKSGMASLLYPQINKPVELMGLKFANRVGLAAGLDKDGEHVDAFGKLGFGFIEVGTVTPKAQPGNAKPRLFRLTPAQAIINRMGFNNLGVDHLVEQVRQRRWQGVLGINVGKNASTPLEQATDDYRLCIRVAHPYADYLTVNISSPNTPGLRNLQGADYLRDMAGNLSGLVDELNRESNRQVPLLVKIAPDLGPAEIEQIADALLQSGVQGVIATNTTLSRDAVKGMKHAAEAGGLSGAPVRDMSTRVIEQLANRLQGRLPIIGVGGILCGEDARQKMDAGADLVQIYSGLIYRGPGLVRNVAKAL